MVVNCDDPHDFPRHHEYKTTPPTLIELRTIPSEHFTQRLEGKPEKLGFLPRVSVEFDKSCDADHVYIKNTSVDNLFGGDNKYTQLTQCFDISCRPLGMTRDTPLTMRLQMGADELDALKLGWQTVALLTFDNNTRSWKEIAPEKQPDGSFTVSVQFYGKFVFCTKPIVDQFLLTEVATRYTILDVDAATCQITIDDDVVDRFGAVISVTKSAVRFSDLERIKNAIGLKNIQVSQVFEFDIQGNSRTKLRELVHVKYTSLAKQDGGGDKPVVVAMKKVGKDGIWEVVDDSTKAFVGMGQSEVMFIETDPGNAQDSQKMVFFGSELDYVLNSSKTSIYVYQHKEQTNRVHIGFSEKTDDCWTQLAKNEGIVLREQAALSYTVANGSVLAEDNSPKQLYFFSNNSTGIDLYLVAKPGAETLGVSIGVFDPVTKELGTVLESTVTATESFSPYIQEKVYEHVEVPEIFREYKLAYLKNLSPLEREKYKHINGM